MDVRLEARAVLLQGAKRLEHLAAELLDDFERSTDPYLRSLPAGALASHERSLAMFGLPVRADDTLPVGEVRLEPAPPERKLGDPDQDYVPRSHIGGKGYGPPAVDCTCPRYPGGGRKETDPTCPLHAGDARD